MPRRRKEERDMLSLKTKVLLSGVALALWLIPTGLVAQAQGPNQQSPSSYAGKFEGTLKDETREQKATLEVLENAGKFSGSLMTSHGSFKVIKGQIADGSLTLEIERPGEGSGTMTLRQNGANLTAP